MPASLSLRWGSRRPVVSPKAIAISRIDSIQTARGYQVSACVDDERIHFSTPDTQLKPIAEAFGTCLLIPALHAQRSLSLDVAVCELWSRNMAEIMALVEPWWGYRPIEIQATTLQSHTERCPATALAFSCGVDSFYSLLRYPGRIDALVCALGYDVKLRDRRRAQSLESALRAVAAGHAIQPVVITTNLRHHRLMKQSRWEDTHGGALAALGHLLSDSYGSFVISSSGARIFNRPWGSHWELDPRFGSRSLTVEHFGDHTLRSKKLIEIASEPTVRQHLRVCWEYRNAAVNCGNCEKCIRTMLTLDVCDQLGQYVSFGNTSGLPQAINQQPYLPTYTIDVYEFLLNFGLSACYQAPVKSLIARSKAHHYGID